MRKKEDNRGDHPENYSYQDDEIQLIDLLRIVWKWKWLIICGTLFCAITAGAVSFLMPKIYEISMVLEPGIIAMNNEGKFQYVDSPANVSAKINERVYQKRLEKTLKIDPFETPFKFKAESDRKGKNNLVRIKSEWSEQDLNLGMKASKEVVRLLFDSYKRLIEQRIGNYDEEIDIKNNEIAKVETERKDIDKQITLKMNSIEEKKGQIRLEKATLKTVRQRIGELMSEIKETKDNTDEIVRQRGELLKGSKADDSLSLLLYSTTIQQNVAYFNELNNQLFELRTREEELSAAIEKLNNDIEDEKTGIARLQLKKTEGMDAEIGHFKAELNALKLKRGIIGNINIVQGAEISTYPVKPKKKLYVLIATVIGLILSTVVAFFIEYIRSAKREQVAFGSELKRLEENP